MTWIRTHIWIICGLAFGATLSGFIVSAALMIHYDNFETYNWLSSLAWLVASAVSLATGVIVNRVSPSQKPVTELKTGLAAWLEPGVQVSAAKTALQRVRECREIAAQYRRNADTNDMQASKAIAEMEAELTAAKALMEVPK